MMQAHAMQRKAHAKTLVRQFGPQLWASSAPREDLVNLSRSGRSLRRASRPLTDAELRLNPAA